MCHTGTFNVLKTSLIPPRRDFKLRELDKKLVELLKNELLRCPLSFAKSLIGIVKGIKSKDDFNQTAIDSYEIEVIGGNHRRQALSEILKEGTREALESRKQTYVQLYTGKLIIFPYLMQLLIALKRSAFELNGIN